MPRSLPGRLGLFLVSLLGLMSLSSASAFASGPPIVTVGAAGNFTLNGATLNGTVNNNGGIGTTYKFEYGKSKVYGTSTKVTSLSGSGTVPVSITLLGLESLTTYHFRVSATNSLGTTVSGDATFETLISWRVGGKYLFELPEPPTLTNLGETLPFTAERTSGGNTRKISCEWGNISNRAVLGVEYNWPLNNCKTTYNGVEEKSCNPNPSSMVLHLNGNLVPTPGQKFVLGEACWMGEQIGIENPFTVAPTAPAVEPTLTFTSPANKVGWTMTLGPRPWFLWGQYTGLTLGVE